MKPYDVALSFKEYVGKRLDLDELIVL